LNRRARNLKAAELLHPCVEAAKTINNSNEVIMTMVASIRSSNHEMACKKCGDTLISPEWSEYFNEEQLVLNFWSCTNCNDQFETETFVPAVADSAKVMSR
jgi:ribosomal protein L37AE/L43A